MSPETSVINRLDDTCHMHDAFIRIMTLSTYPKNKASLKYLYHQKYSQLYELQKDTLLIYKTKGRNFHLQSTRKYQLPNDCHQDMILHHSSELLIIYSCKDITFISIDGTKIIEPHSNNYSYSKLLVFEDLLIINHKTTI